MKNGILWVFNTKISGLTRLNLHSLPQRQSFMEEKLCYVYGGIILSL